MKVMEVMKQVLLYCTSAAYHVSSVSLSLSRPLCLIILGVAEAQILCPLKLYLAHPSRCLTHPQSYLPWTIVSLPLHQWSGSGNVWLLAFLDYCLITEGLQISFSQTLFYRLFISYLQTLVLIVVNTWKGDRKSWKGDRKSWKGDRKWQSWKVIENTERIEEYEWILIIIIILVIIILVIFWNMITIQNGLIDFSKIILICWFGA